MAKIPYTPLPPDTDRHVLGLFTRDRGFYRSFFPLLCVISLQQLAALAVNMADNLMLGTYTELALSGATLVNQLQFTLQQITSGMGMGIVVLASQYWGQRRVEPIRHIISLGMKFALLAGLLFFAAAKLIPFELLGLFTKDEAVIEEGVRYLNIISWTYLIYALSSALMYSLQSVETAMVGTVMSLSTLCINVCLNYCLIYGHFGAPELGVEGAAIATLTSRVVELIIILVYVLKVDRKLHLKLSHLLAWEFGYLRDYLRVATPMVISGLLWGIAQAAQTAVLGHLSATVIAANSIATTIFQIFVVIGMAASNAGSVVIGKTIGSGDLHLLKGYAKTLQGIFLCCGVVFGGLMFLCKDAIVRVYTVSPEAKTLAVQFITILSVTAVGSCYEYPTEAGIIGGGGMTEYAAWMDNLFMWLFTIPSACLSAFVFHWSPVVTFCFLKADQLLKCIPNSIVCNRYHWVRVLTKEKNQETQ